VHDIGAGAGIAFQRHQLIVLGAQMRGAVEDMIDEARLSERK
jgi:hypothetical protein